MRKLLDFFFLICLVCVLALAPVSNLAAQELAPDRAPASQKNGKPLLTEQAWKSLNQAYLLKVVRETNDLADQVKTRKDYERVYLSKVHPKDRAFYTRVDHGDFKPIKVKLDGDTLLFREKEAGEVILRVQWPNLTENRLVVNGVEWKFDLTKRMEPQLDLLRKKLDYKSGQHASAALTLLFPSAEAVISPTMLITLAKYLGVAAGTTFVGALMSKETLCFVTSSGIDRLIPTYCTEVKDALDKAAKKELETRSAKVGTLELAKPKSTDVDGQIKWIPSKEQNCPAAADATRNVFSADMLQLQVINGPKGGKVVPKNDWFALRIEFNGDKRPKSGFLAPQGTNTADPGAAQTATDILTFDDRGFLKEIRYKNSKPNENNDPTYKEMLTIDMNTDDTKLSTEEVARRTTIRSLVGSLDEWITFCNTKELIYKYLEQKKAGTSPQTSDVEVVNGRPAPPPVEPPAAAPAAPAKAVQ